MIYRMLLGLGSVRKANEPDRRCNDSDVDAFHKRKWNISSPQQHRLLSPNTFETLPKIVLILSELFIKPEGKDYRILVFLNVHALLF